MGEGQSGPRPIPPTDATIGKTIVCDHPGAVLVVLMTPQLRSHVRRDLNHSPLDWAVSSIRISLIGFRGCPCGFSLPKTR